MFFRKRNWNVVGWFNIVSTISYAIIGIGVAVMLYHAAIRHGEILKRGLSFTGGTDVTVDFKKSVTAEHIRSALVPLGVTDAQVNTITKAGDVGTPRYTIATQKDFGNDTPALWSALNGVAPVDRTQSQIQAVGPSLSHEYLIRALEALLIAIAIQFIYIAFRFNWNYIFGLVTIVALARDALVMISIYAVADRRVDDAFLAAVLTVVGYSVMDTIVILDRIRENTKLMVGEAYDRIVNTSILQTMTRSVNTLATVIITLVALYAFGGVSLRNFAFALLVGICSGGYHSIFYSAPLVYRLRSWQLKREARSRALRRANGTDASSRPRTVAEARSAEQGAAERANVIAARKARRERERAAAAQRPPNGAPRYKRRRPEITDTAIGTVEPEIESEYDSDVEYAEHDHDHGYEIDPLDAQRAGHHDRDYELGHEEINLNLGDDPTGEHGDQVHDHDHDGHDHTHEVSPRPEPRRE